MKQEIADARPPAETRLLRIPAPDATELTLGVLEKRGDPIAPRLPPVLLVHGATLGANLFDVPRPGYSLMAWLASRARAVYGLDVRGFGNSLGGRIMDAESDAHAPFARADEAVGDIGAAVDFILARERVETVDLIGFSWGTITSALYAASAPERIARLALYAPLYAEVNPLWLDRIADPGAPSRLNPRIGAYRLVTKKELISRWDADLPTHNPNLYRECGIAELLFEVFAGLDPRSRSLERSAFRCPAGPLADLTSVFNGRPLYDPRKLTMPTLLVRGSDDTTSTDTDARRLLAAIASPRKSYCVITPGSHFLIMKREPFRAIPAAQRLSETYQQLTGAGGPTLLMSRPAVAGGDNVHTIWQPDTDVTRRLTLAAILENNPLPIAYRLNYLANFYVGPLIKNMEQDFGMTRPEWIVLFCLTRRSGLSAQQISDVTGRPKTSISAAVKQLQSKRLLSRTVDANDGRRRVLQITEAGRRIYSTILEGFVLREGQMVACLSKSERSAFLHLLNKMIDNSAQWAKPY